MAVMAKYRLSMKDELEIIANVTLSTGFAYMRVQTPVTPENVATAVFADRQRNGETIANSLALQGLTMLDWLNPKPSD